MIRRALTFVLVAVAGLALSATPGCVIVLANAIPGNGQLTTTTRQVTGFTRVRLDGGLDADVREGPAFSCQVTADENLQGYVTAEVHGQTLVIGTRQGSLGFSRGSKAVVTLPKLRGLTTSGSGDATVEVGSAGAPLSLTSSGSGALDLTAGAAGDLDVNLSGSGDATLRGAAGHLAISTSGSGDVDGGHLVAQGADVATSGSGDVHLHLEGGRSSFHTSGSGDVSWTGHTQIEDVSVSGSGSVTHRS